MFDHLTGADKVSLLFHKELCLNGVRLVAGLTPLCRVGQVSTESVPVQLFISGLFGFGG
jgi:hypothetical protein